MDKFSFLQDVKVTVWVRQKFDIEAESYDDALTKIERFKTEDVSASSDFDIDTEWLFESWEPIDPKDNGNAATIELYAEYDPNNPVWTNTIKIGDNAVSDIPLSDRKDLYVIRTLMYMGDEQEYFYWMDTDNDHLTRGLRNDHNATHIFEEKDKVLAERICELLNKSQHEHHYEVVSFYDAWRCL